jgi:hypothetical protein
MMLGREKLPRKPIPASFVVCDAQKDGAESSHVWMTPRLIQDGASGRPGRACTKVEKPRPSPCPNVTAS